MVSGKIIEGEIPAEKEELYFSQRNLHPTHTGASSNTHGNNTSNTHGNNTNITNINHEIHSDKKCIHNCLKCLEKRLTTAILKKIELEQRLREHERVKRVVTTCSLR